MATAQQKFDPETNYYQILDVPYSASRKEITRAYRELMRYAHPDHARTEMDRRKAEERSKMLNEAYAVLGRPEVRREYDQVFKTQAVNDALFSQYTGNMPGQQARHMHRPTRPPETPEMRRARTRANRSALMQIMLITGLFVAIIIAAVVLMGVVWQIGTLVV